MAKEKLEIIKALALIVGAILTALTVAARTYLSPLVYGLIVFLFVLMVIIVWPFSVRPAFKFLKNEIKIWKHNRLSKKYFDEFTGFVNNFDNFCGRKNPVGVLIRNLIHDDKYFKEFSEHLSNDYNESLRHGYLPDTFNLFKRRVNKFKGTKEDFLLLVAEFENLLDAYYTFFIYKLHSAVEEVGRDKVYKNYREEYNNNFRVYYNDFIKNYTIYGRKVNDKFGEDIIKTNFEMVEEL